MIGTNSYKIDILFSKWLFEGVTNDVSLGCNEAQISAARARTSVNPIDDCNPAEPSKQSPAPVLKHNYLTGMYM
jgi:hypothetical protein